MKIFFMEHNEIQNRLAFNLKKIRKEKKLTQFALAEKADLSEETIKSIELERTWPSEKTLAMILSALEIDVVQLFTPSPTSFEINEIIQSSVKQALSQGFQNYVDSVTEEITTKC